MLSWIKKVLLYLTILIAVIFLSSICLIFTYEDKIIDLFKKKIIDQSSIKVCYSKIDFTIFKNFPKGSITIDNVTICYPDNPQDTLVSSKKVTISGNIISALKGFFSFSEISINNGFINIDQKKFENLLKAESNDDKYKSLGIEIEKIYLKDCILKYRYDNSFETRFYVLKSFVSGSIKNQTYYLKVNLSCNRILTRYNSKDYNYPYFVKLSTKIYGNSNGLFSEDGNLELNSISFNSFFKYTSTDNIFKLKIASKKIDLKSLFSVLPCKGVNIFDKGTISFDANYSVCIDKLESQKVSIDYRIKNLVINTFKNPIYISSLDGRTFFYENFEKNTSDIFNVTLKYDNTELSGNGKVKQYPNPYILLDLKISSNKHIEFPKNISLSGEIAGNIKSLIKIEDVYNLNINNVKIIKVNSHIGYSNLSFENVDIVKNLTGEVQIDDNLLTIRSKGLMEKSAFEGTLVVQNIIDVLFKNKPLYPTITVNISALNLNDYTSRGKKGSSLDSLNFFLIGKVNKILYKDNCFYDLKFKLNSINNRFIVDTFSISAFSGNIAGKISSLDKKNLDLSASFQKIDVKTVLKTFNNFNQSIITEKNISGNLSGILNLSSNLCGDYQIIPGSIKLESKLILDNGSLTGMNQFKQISKFLRLDEQELIKFKTLQNSISINNGIVYIPTMNISSGAMNIQLSGEHNFNGYYTYWLKMNLRDILAKRFFSTARNDNEYDDNKENGINLFLKVDGNPKSFTINYDKKNAVKHLKVNINNEGLLLKKIFKDEFASKKNDTSFTINNRNSENKKDTLNNKTAKKAFKLEWDEIDTTKVY